MIEGVDPEFKELDRMKGTLPDSIPKEIVAFANTEGGELYVGIRNDGSVVGVADPDDVMTRISNVAHDTILPDVMPFIQIRPIEMEGKQVVKTTIAVGTERPYYLAKEGLKPKGVDGSPEYRIRHCPDEDSEDDRERWTVYKPCASPVRSMCAYH